MAEPDLGPNMVEIPVKKMDGAENASGGPNAGHSSVKG